MATGREVQTAGQAPEAATTGRRRPTTRPDFSHERPDVLHGASVRDWTISAVLARRRSWASASAASYRATPPSRRLAACPRWCRNGGDHTTSDRATIRPASCQDVQRGPAKAVPGRSLLAAPCGRCVEEALADTRVVLVNGARQAGKSTLVAQIGAARGAEWRSLDRATTREAARYDPTGFVSPRARW